MSGRGRGSRREGWRCPAPRYPEGGARPCRWRSPAGAPQPAATPAPTQAFGTPHLSNLAQAKHRDSVSDSHVSHPTSDCLSILPAPRRVKLHTCSTLAPGSQYCSGRCDQEGPLSVPGRQLTRWWSIHLLDPGSGLRCQLHHSYLCDPEQWILPHLNESS